MKVLSFVFASVASFLVITTVIEAETKQTPVISSDQAASLELDLELQPAYLREEIVKLKEELATLNTELETITKDKQNLYDKIEDYKRQEQFSENALFKIVFLRNVISESFFAESNINDEDYNAAIEFINNGDLSSAESKLAVFLTKKVDLSNYVDKSTNSKITPQKLSSLQQDLDTKIDKANFLNGYVKLLLFKPKEAADYLARSYNSTKNINLALLNLIALIDVFYATGQNSEACFTVKSFESATKQLSTRNIGLPKFVNDKIINRVKSIKREFSCN